MPNPIIIPCGKNNPITGSPMSGNALIKENYLGEFETEEDRAKARINLGVKSEEEIDKKFTELNELTSQLTKKLVKHLLDLNDPHKTLKKLQEELDNYVKKDGSTPFTKPQIGVTPLTESHLTTKSYVDKAIKEYFVDNNIKADNELFEKVKKYLSKYALIENTYRKDQVYCKQEIAKAFDEVILKNGSVPFNNPVSGRDPISDSHLTTKRYVDKSIEKHLLAEDPHGVKMWMLDVLKGYASKADMAKVNEQDVRRYAEERVRELLNNLADSTNPLRLAERLKEWGYVKNDGTTPFISPQPGIPAVQPNELVTLEQVKEIITNITSKIEEQFKNQDELNHWYTEGPVETTVGFVEDNTNLPDALTLQQIMDLIFYGKGITINVPKWAEPGSIVKVCLKMSGSPKRIAKVTLKQDGKVIWVGTGDDFDNPDKEVCIDSDKLTNDPTIWTVDIEYLKGSASLQEKTHLIGGAFYGILDVFNHASTLQYSDYMKLALEDPVNIKKVVDGDFKNVTVEFNFEAYKKPKQIFCAVPMKYPNLKKLVTKAQSFNVNDEGWNIVTAIPLDINGVSTMYKVYVYKEPIVALTNEEVTFVF